MGEVLHLVCLKRKAGGGVELPDHISTFKRLRRHSVPDADADADAAEPLFEKVCSFHPLLGQQRRGWVMLEEEYERLPAGCSLAGALRARLGPGAKPAKLRLRILELRAEAKAAVVACAKDQVTSFICLS